HAAHFAALEVLAVEHGAEYLGEFLQRRRLYTAEGGDAQYHVVAQFVVEQFENVGRLAPLEVDQNGGDDLRVLLADHLRHQARIHDVQRVDTGIGAALFENVLDQAGG